MADRYTQVARATLWLVQGDDFVMGGDAPDAGPPFTISVGSIYIGKSAITNEQYEAFAPDHERPAVSPGNDDPAVGVTFHDAAAYCDWYSRLAKKQFRLPTEAEWEFACRGGTTSRYFFGDDPAGANPYVWHRDNSGGHCHPAESARANPAGLHEMLGNVWEWTSSAHRPYPIVDGDGRDEPADQEEPHVVRGGSFRTAIAEIGSAVRRPLGPDARFDDVGFRIVRSL